jgi:hypothetical protein
MKVFTLQAEALKLAVNFFVNCTFGQMNDWLVKRDYEAIDEKWKKNTLGLYASYYNEKENSMFYGIWLPKFKRDAECMGTLVHELSHIVDAQVEEKDLEGTEVKAYLIEYYFKEFLRKFK